MKTIITAILLLGLGGGSAQALGFSQKRTGHYDFLFLPVGETALRVQNITVLPDRGYSNGSGISTGTRSTETDVNPPFSLSQFDLRHEFNDTSKCLFQIAEPFQNRAQLNDDWAAANDQESSEISSVGLETLCAFDLNSNPDTALNFVVGAGLSKMDVSRVSESGTPLTDTTMDVSTKGSAFNFVLGTSYEIEKYALRADLFYHSAVFYDLEGFAYDVPGVPVPVAITTKLRVPQAIEARFQSGFAPGWLGDIGLKWQEWSKLDKLVVPELGPATVLTNYKNGFEVTAGVAHILSDDAILTGRYRYTKGIEGGYTDLHTFLIGGRQAISENGAVLGALAYTKVMAGENSGVSMSGTPFSYDIDAGSAVSVVLGYEHTF